MREPSSAPLAGCAFLLLGLLSCKQVSELVSERGGDKPASSATLPAGAASMPALSSVSPANSGSAPSQPPSPTEPAFVKAFPSVEKATCRMAGKAKWGHLNWAGGSHFDQDPAWVYWVEDRTIGRVRKSDGKREILHRANLGPRDKIGGISAHDAGLYFTMHDGLYLLPRIPGEHRPGFPKPKPTLVVENFGMVFAEDHNYFYGARSEKTSDPEQFSDVLSRVDKQSKKAEELFRMSRKQAKYPPFGFSAIVVDPTHIYIANATSYELFKLPKAGGKAENLLDSRQRIVQMKGDAHSLYYTVEYTTQAVKQLRKLTKSGGKSELIGSVPPEVPFVLAEDGLYVLKLVDDKQVFPTKIDKGGKELRDFGNTTRPPIAVDDECLYVTYLDEFHEYVSAWGLAE